MPICHWAAGVARARGALRGGPARRAGERLRCARAVGGVVLPTLYAGTERERDPETLAHLGFADTAQYIVGMDFPDNSTPSYYFREEIFALTVREYLRLLVKQGYKLVVLVNGHGATGQMSSLSRLAAEFTGETGTRVLVGFPAASLGFPGEDPGHATRAEISQAMALTDSVDLTKLPPAGEPIYMWKTGMADGSAFAGHPSADFSVQDDPRTGRPGLGRALPRRGRGGAHRAGARGLGAGLRGLSAAETICTPFVV